MHITLEADYAIRIMLALAANTGRMDAGSISQEAVVSLRFALKILRKLVNSGLVQSFKGVKGGYELAKDPADITLYDIISTIEGEYRLSRCLSEDYNCPAGRKAYCEVRKIFDGISLQVRDRLSGVHLSDILKREEA